MNVMMVRFPVTLSMYMGDRKIKIKTFSAGSSVNPSRIKIAMVVFHHWWLLFKQHAQLFRDYYVEHIVCINTNLISSIFITFSYYILNHNMHMIGLPGGSVVKISTYQCRRCKRQGFNPWVGKIPYRRKWQHPPRFSPGNPMDWRTWWATIHGIAKESDRTLLLKNNNNMHMIEYIAKVV